MIVELVLPQNIKVPYSVDFLHDPAEAQPLLILLNRLPLVFGVGNSSFLLLTLGLFQVEISAVQVILRDSLKVVNTSILVSLAHPSFWDNLRLTGQE